MNKKTFLFLAIPIIVLGLAPLTLPDTSFANIITEFFQNIWQGFVDALYRVWDWIKAIWDSYFEPFFQSIWQGANSLFTQEYDRRKLSAEKEISGDKAEAIEIINSVIAKIPDSIWGAAKNFFKKIGAKIGLGE